MFSFGVVLLELLTGRKPVDSFQPPGQESLVDWVLTYIYILGCYMLAFGDFLFVSLDMFMDLYA